MSAVPPTPAPPANEPPSLVEASNPVPLNPYRVVFGDIAAYVQAEKWTELTRVAELADLKTYLVNDASRLLVVAPLVLTYLITDELSAARFALLRLPPALASQPLPHTLFRLLSASSSRDYSHIYSYANELASVLNAGAASAEAELATVLQNLLDKFLSSFRHRTFSLLRQTFTSLPLAEAQKYLSSEPDVILQAAKDSREWAYDPSTQLLTPLPISQIKSSFAGRSSTLYTFDVVSTIAAKLESGP